MAISLSDTAAQRVQSFVGEHQALGMRFGVRKTGCSGWAYVVDLAHEQRATDAVFTHPSGAKVFVDPDSMALVDGTEIDFARQGINQTFIFHNPNVKAECGCGESFSTEIGAEF